MSLDDSRLEAWQKMQEANRRGRVQQDSDLPLFGGGGDGTSGGVEARVAKLEAQVEQLRVEVGRLASLPADMAGVKSDLSSVKVSLGRFESVPSDIATLKERVANLPTKDELGNKLRAYMLTTTALVGAVVGVITLIAKLIGQG